MAITFGRTSCGILCASGNLCSMLGTWRWLWPAFHLSCLPVRPRLQLGRRPVWSAPLLKSVGFKMVIHYANKSFQFTNLWQMYNENEISKFCLLLSHWKISENQPRYSWFFFVIQTSISPCWFQPCKTAFPVAWHQEASHKPSCHP